MRWCVAVSPKDKWEWNFARNGHIWHGVSDKWLNVTLSECFSSKAYLRQVHNSSQNLLCVPRISKKCFPPLVGNAFQNCDNFKPICIDHLGILSVTNERVRSMCACERAFVWSGAYVLYLSGYNVSICLCRNQGRK